MNPLKMIMSAFMRGPSCEDCNGFLAEYIDGTLPEETRQQFEKHLNRCPACLTYFEQYKKTIELVKEDEDVQIPEQLVEHTLAFLRERIGSS